MSQTYIGKTCPYCKTPLTQNDTIAVCGVCDMPHHLSCWQDNMGCTTFGCTGKIREIINDEIIPPAAPTPVAPAPVAPVAAQPAPTAAYAYAAPAAPVQAAVPEKPIEILQESKELVFQENMPVVLENTALIIDRIKNKLFARCTFRCITDKPIQAVLVEISCQDVWGVGLGEPVAFQYLDLRTKRESKFGQTNPIELPDMATRKIQVTVKKVLFADESVLAGGAVVMTMPVPFPLLQQLQSKELVEEYARETTSKAQYVPVCTDSYWRCTCGSINTAADETCHACNCTKDVLLAALNTEALTANMQALIAEKRAAEEKARAEQAERIRLAEEQVKRDHEERERERQLAASIANQKKKKKRTVAAIIASVIVLVLLACGTIFFGIPYLNYQAACNALDGGNFDTAYQGFVKLDGFMDSEVMAKEALYRKGKAALQKQEYDAAHQIFVSLGTYEDSVKMAKECLYQKGKGALLNKKYDEAYKIFTDLGNYENSAEMAKECRYQKAKSLLNSKKYAEAYTIFIELGNYSDSKDMANESKYQQGCSLMNQKSYEAAITIFKSISQYKNSSTKIQECMYAYVLAHKNNDDTTTYSYLKTLKSQNYKDASTIYKDLYSWKVTVLGWNSDTDSDTYKTSISKYRAVICHFELSGGTPGASTVIHVKSVYPNGNTYEYDFSNAWSDDWSGWYGWEDGLYTTPKYGSTGTLKLYFYDDDGNLIGRASIKITG